MMISGIGSPGSITTTGKVTIPDTLADGNYLLNLRFPDKAPSLESNPAYSIQLANVGLWNAALGINSLNHLVVVGSGGEGSLPAKPTLLMASVISASQIDLSWADNSSDETAVEVYRCPDESNEWKLLATLPANSANYSDQGLEPLTTYSYIIRTGNANGKSDWSEKVVVTTLSNNIKQNLENNISIYPNPLINGSLYVYAETNSKVNISISGLDGKQLYSSLDRNNPVEINDLKLDSGMYLVTIKTSNKTTSKKLIIP